MVYVNSQKFACASCIKGHRSSSCHHTDRPLFEIKKKGRPISQCEKCRELRKNKRMHVKCNCVIPTHEGHTRRPSASATPSMPRRPARREPPQNPTLPNGLRDLQPKGSASQGVDSNPRQRVDALLNPCNCKSVWKCKCSNRSDRSFVKPVSEADRDDTDIYSPSSPTVKSCCGGTVTKSVEHPAQLNDTLIHGLRTPTSSAASHREQRHLVSMLYASSFHASTSTFSHPMSSERHTHEALDDQLMCLDLPPLKFPSATGPDLGLRTLPSLRDLYDPTDNATADEALRSLTKCGCGSSCACPGCKEHRGAEFAALSEEDCPDGCGSCVDHMGGLGLPSASSITLPSPISNSSPTGMQGDLHGHAKHPSTAMSSLDHFHAVAALLPPPPSSSRLGTLDPTNVTVYQPSSSNGVQKHDWQRAAGLVQVPPLNCCDGRCKCPGGMCGCGSECGGGCGRHGAGAGTVSRRKEMPRAGDDFSRDLKENGGENIRGACCAGKNVTGSASPPSSKKVSRL